MDYHSLNTDPEVADRTEISLEKPGPNPKHFWQKIKSQDWDLRKIVLVAGVSLLAIWGAIDASSRGLQLARSVLRGENRSPCWCGTSDEEAVAMGCIWDHIAVDWLPPHCVDPALVAEFDVAGSGPAGAWPYYISDLQKVALLTETQRTPVNLTDIDRLAREGREYWTTVEWHISHCLFTWRKQVRSAGGGVSVEPWNDKEAHASHCSEYIWNVVRTGRPLDEVSTVILGKDRHVDE
ncbi:hypothetical protein PG994_002758 [Apiospora phragmitis]|uniref:Uncharacterized protein n=1 Tax=Apiospora phragmitis TaxID=2905665 RepID=A0ABR1W8U2_9PEZI